MKKKTNKSLLWQLPFLVLLIIGTVFIIKQQNSTPYQYNEGQIFGTFDHITYQNNENLQKEIIDCLLNVDNELSTFFNSASISFCRFSLF